MAVVGRPHPIDSFGDVRLVGSSISGKFFDVFSEWIDPLWSNPVIQEGKWERRFEYGRRSFTALVATIGMVVASPLLLIAKICQIVHFYSLSKQHRANPPAVKVHGFELPKLRDLTPQEANETVLEHTLTMREAQYELRPGDAEGAPSRVVEAGILFLDSGIEGAPVRPIGGKPILDIDQLNQDATGPQSKASCLSFVRGGSLLKDEDPPLEYRVFTRARDTIRMSEVACFAETSKQLASKKLGEQKFTFEIAGELAKKNGYRAFRFPDSTIYAIYSFDNLVAKVTGPRESILWESPPPPGAPVVHKR